MADMRRECPPEMSRPAGHVEHLFTGTRLQQPDNPVQPAGGKPRVRERRRLQPELLECGQLFWPRLVRISSLVLAPPSGVVVVGGGVSSPVLAPPLCE
jgi:hypothetical protein